MNPFQMMGGTQQGNPFGTIQAMQEKFQQFRQTMNGNPEQVLNQLMQSGKVNQQMVNQAQQMAHMFGQFLK